MSEVKDKILGLFLSLIPITMIACVLGLLIFGLCNTDRLDKNVKTTDCCYKIVEIETGGVLYIENDRKLTPYYNKNGKLCHYVDGEIKEIE